MLQHCFYSHLKIDNTSTFTSTLTSLVKSLQIIVPTKTPPRDEGGCLNPLTGNKIGEQVLLAVPLPLMTAPLNKHIICINCTINEHIQEWCSACFEWSQLM